MHPCPESCTCTCEFGWTWWASPTVSPAAWSLTWAAGMRLVYRLLDERGITWWWNDSCDSRTWDRPVVLMCFPHPTAVGGIAVKITTRPERKDIASAGGIAFARFFALLFFFFVTKVASHFVLSPVIVRPDAVSCTFSQNPVYRLDELGLQKRSRKIMPAKAIVTPPEPALEPLIQCGPCAARNAFAARCISNIVRSQNAA